MRSDAIYIINLKTYQSAYFSASSSGKFSFHLFMK